MILLPLLTLLPHELEHSMGPDGAPLICRQRRSILPQVHELEGGCFFTRHPSGTAVVNRDDGRQSLRQLMLYAPAQPSLRLQLVGIEGSYTIVHHECVDVEDTELVRVHVRRGDWTLSFQTETGGSKEVLHPRRRAALMPYKAVNMSIIPSAFPPLGSN